MGFVGDDARLRLRVGHLTHFLCEWYLGESRLCLIRAKFS